MGSQPEQVQGRTPGEAPPGEEGESVFEAVGTVIAVVAVIILLILGSLYLGGWAAHVAVDIVCSGWESK